MRVLILFITVGLWLAAKGQSQFPMHAAATKERAKWSADLFDIGMEKKKDAFYEKEETARLMKDSAYRREV